MMLIIYFGIFTLTFLFLFIKRFRKRTINFKNKNILVIGGTSGLGRSIAEVLSKYESNITIAARKRNNDMPQYRFTLIDVINLDTFVESDTTYDFIYCCAGNVLPGFFHENDLNNYKKQIEVNYIGTINALSHYSRNNKRPFSFIMIASTIAYFTFPGYSAYAPSKAALKSFYDSANLEFKKMNIDLYIYYVNSMDTPGFEAENLLKPKFTKEIEGVTGMNSTTAAEILLKEMEYSNVICSDKITRLFKTKCEIDCFGDYLYMILSLVLYPIIRLYIGYKFKSYDWIE